MKGQVTNLALVIIFSLIIVSGTVYFVLDKTSDVSQTVSVVEYELFVNNLENTFSNFFKTKNKGSKETLSIVVPRGIEKICFIDRSNSFDEFYSPELKGQIDFDTENNVFIEPNNLPSQKIEGFRLEDDKNPLCIKIQGNKLNIKIESAGNTTKVTGVDTAEFEEKECISVIENGNSDEKVDLVFLSHNYENTEQFTNDVIEYVDVLKSLEPFNSNFDKFNVFIATEEADCELVGYIKCNNYALKKAASSCPNDYIFVLSERKKSTDLLIPIRSSSIGNIAKVNTADDRLVVAHEFGHSFADLWDEYVEDSYYSTIISYKDYYKLPNCDESGCPEWKNEDGTKKEGTSCFKGCTLSSFYRGTDNSIMNDFRKSSGEEFGPINEEIILKILEKYK